MTLKEASKLVDGLSVYRLRTLCRDGSIKHHRFGNKIMVTEAEVLKFFGFENNKKNDIMLSGNTP